MAELGKVSGLGGRSLITAGLAVAVSVSTATSAYAHDVGDARDMWNQDGKCLEGRNELRDQPSGLTGVFYGAHSDMSGTVFGLCLGNPPIEMPAGWLAAPSKLWINDHDNGWVMCESFFNVSQNQNSSVSMTRDWGKWVPCTQLPDKRTKQVQVWTAHFFFENGQWWGEDDFRTGYHYFRNGD